MEEIGHSNSERLFKRQKAAALARSYLSGQITRSEFFDGYPDYTGDPKLLTLYNKISHEKKPHWLFGPSREAHADYVLEALGFVATLEDHSLKPAVMYSLFKELGLGGDNYRLPVSNIGLRLLEVAKSTNSTKDEIREYLTALIDQGYVKRLAGDALLFEFTDSGKTIKTQADVEKLFSDVFKS